MTIKKTANPGQNISFSDIEDEFGQNNGRNLGEYRVSKTVGEMNNLPLDDDIPQGTSQISFSDFAQKQLNVIVHYAGSQNRPQTGRQKYNNNSGVTVIGGFKSRPSNSSGTRVVLHVSGTIGSSKSGRTHCALRTGTGWNSETELEVNVGGEGLISGAGGNGGEGGKNHDENGSSGSTGSSALGVEYSLDKVVVQNGGAIRAGGGGGGGGGGGKEDSQNDDRRASGGGGGGGAGIPAGEGASGGGDPGGRGHSKNEGFGGTDGSTNGGGNGGDGGHNDNEAKGGGGGGGGSFGEDGEGGGIRSGGSNGNDGGEGNSGGGGNGGNGKGNESSAGGQGGTNGYAIVKSSGVSVGPTSGSISGGTANSANVN